MFACNKVLRSVCRSSVRCNPPLRALSTNLIRIFDTNYTRKDKSCDSHGRSSWLFYLACNPPGFGKADARSLRSQDSCGGEPPFTIAIAYPVRCAHLLEKKLGYIPSRLLPIVSASVLPLLQTLLPIPICIFPLKVLPTGTTLYADQSLAFLSKPLTVLIPFLAFHSLYAFAFSSISG